MIYTIDLATLITLKTLSIPTYCNRYQCLHKGYQNYHYYSEIISNKMCKNLTLKANYTHTATIHECKQ